MFIVRLFLKFSELLLIGWLISPTKLYVRGDFQVCTPNFCLYSKCDDSACKNSGKGSNKILFHNVTTCGCCNRCIEQLDEGSDCLLEMKGNLPDTQCGPHLRCSLDRKSPTNAACKKISEVTRSGCEHNRIQVGSSQFRMIFDQQPECDQFGDYAVRQCRHGTLCQCVKPFLNITSGELQIQPIFGTDVYTKRNSMNCLCSYQFEKMNEKLREFVNSLEQNQRRTMADSKDLTHWPNQIEPIFSVRCKPNGNYEPFQIYGNYTYCVEESTGKVIDRPVRYEHAKDLPCYSHRYSFQTACLSHYNKMINEYHRIEKNLKANSIGFDDVNCDLDGSYSPVQCENDKCYCVDKSGRKYPKTSVDRNDDYFARTQQCTCVRNQDLIRQITKRDKITEIFSKYHCDQNGNYLPLQCSTTECYCVDPITGFAVTDGSLKTEKKIIKSFKCYLNYPNKQLLDLLIDI
ncbi:Homeobox protein GBX-1 [Sarcoptes scabiei]|nr:Homeobox protein GBX-1 [Sarcoptes scabiei]